MHFVEFLVGRKGVTLPQLLTAALLFTTLSAACFADNPTKEKDEAEAKKPRPSTAELLPAVTKSFVSVNDLDAAMAAWEKTQFGKLMNDPLMKDFVESIDRQIDEKLTETGARLGLSWEDIRNVYGGEISLASMQPPGPKPTENYAMCVLVDVSGKAGPVDKLLKKIEANMVARKAVIKAPVLAGVTVTMYELPRKRGVRLQQKAIVAVHDNWLLATDHTEMATDILQRIRGQAMGQSLAATDAFQQVMKRMPQGNGAPAHARFFVEPFGMMEVARAARRAGRRSRTRKTDRLAAFRRQGFSSVEGLGGQIGFDAGGHDVIYHAYIYSPVEKRVQAAQMLDFPNAGGVAPMWTPGNAGSVLILNWKLLKAFNALEPLVNELMGEDVWEEIIASIEKDINGPQINLRNDLVKLMQDRMFMMTDIKTPITGESERIAVAIPLKNADKVTETVKKTFQRDPHAEPILHLGKTIYEIRDPANRTRLLNNMSIVVYHDHLLAATSTEYLKQLMDRKPDGAFQQSTPFNRIETALKNLGANGDAAKSVTDSQRSLMADYELIRQNQLPGAKTMLAKLMDNLYPTGDEAVKRQPRIDGTKLPPFAKVKHYFQPRGFFVHSEPTGWRIIGCVVKEPPKAPAK